MPDEHNAVVPKRSSNQPKQGPRLWDRFTARCKTAYSQIREYQRGHKVPAATFFRAFWKFLTYDIRDNSIIAIFTALIFFGTVAYSVLAYFQWQAIEDSTRIAQESAGAARKSADTAERAFVVSNRPWIKISPRITKPLTFDVPAIKGRIASMEVEDKIVNVGSTVAVNVFVWEDIFPIAPGSYWDAAKKAQSKWCDDNRKHFQVMTGNAIFPHDEPFIQIGSMAASMKDVEAAASQNKSVFNKVGFVMAGCVVYRAPFEELSVPTHQTRFVYLIGTTEHEFMYLFVTPTGVAKNLGLIGPIEITAD